MTMDFMTGVVIVAAMAAACVAYGIFTASRGASDERRIKHAEFVDRLEPLHRETMAQMNVDRAVEIAKATGRQPPQTIDGDAKQIAGS